MKVEIYAKIIRQTLHTLTLADWSGVQRTILKSKIIDKKQYGREGQHYAITLRKDFAKEKGFINHNYA